LKNIFNFFKNNLDTKLLIVADDNEANIASDIVSYFGKEPFVLSDFRANYQDDLLSFSQELHDIITTLDRFHSYKKQNKILIAPIRTISFRLPKQECFDKFKIEFASIVDLQNLKSKLYDWGYYFVDIVTSEGEVSIRGDIIDIYPLGNDDAFRVSLFDNEVESIRRFDVQTQKSFKDELEDFEIHPAFLSIPASKLEIINQKIESSNSDVFIKDIHSLGFWYLDDLAEFYTDILKPNITKNALDEIEEAYIFDEYRIEKEKLLSLPAILNNDSYKEIAPSNIDEFINFHKDKKITIISSSEAKIKSLLSFETLELKPKILYKNYIINLLSKDEVIISLNKEIKKRKKRKIKIVLDELKTGDFVVHQEYGIGQFEGIEPIVVMGAKRDFVKINYAGDDKLFIPVENIDIIDRYLANSGSVAVLDKLGKGSFAKLKSKVKDKLFAIASDIIALAAKRELTNGIKIDTNKEAIKLFRQDAGFEYTKDQQRSIKELFDDLNSGIAMDRLLSGDVGFGKTEVAMNGILATVLSGYQCLFVVPTTLLSQQHYTGLKDRLEKYGVKIGKVDGRTSTKDKNYFKKEFEAGNIHLLIGTHSLLNIKSKNLALVVIDEEHKFGVRQKEKLKELREDVHIFSMSATPIPRTLNLALSKIKGMSSLLTAPKQRLGVRTYLKEYNPQLIKEIILREKRRGGQIFYIHNSIANIENKKEDLLEILPNISIAVIHSQIKPAQTQKIMEDFANGKYDILLATSIVESGLHLPNANSIIIDGSNNFGIADLHQLRGRVGRGAKEGFCYLIVEDKEKLTNDAIKRLVALENNSYLGSGSTLAHQDLEIRGGGNIIGEAQSGHIKHIGYSLYLKMLEDALATLSGEQKNNTETIDIKLSISAYISNDYISEDRIRLELYRRLSKVQDHEQLYEIQDEMEDRFGKLDIVTKQFIDLINIKIKALSQNIKSISNYEINISIVYNDDTKVTIKSSSKDDDDLIKTVLKFLNRRD
jgi:transcription-repair coupling factor (superfamily II helicase)